MGKDTHLRAADYAVRFVELHEMGKVFIEIWHYSKSAGKTSIYRHGLYHRLDELTQIGPYGIALWHPAMRNIGKGLDCEDNEVLSLSRLAIEPGLPTNAASFLLGRSMKLIDRERWPVLVTYADTRMGHTGAIYKATNWRCDGEVPGGTQWKAPDGSLRGVKRPINPVTGGRTQVSDCVMVEAGYVKLPPSPKIRFVHDVRKR